MSATDELRRMLDERGVEWKARPDGVTEWVNDGMTCKAVDRTTVGIEHLTMLIPVLTPEQAITATLGAGTCSWEYPQGVNGWVGYSICSSCGERFDECVTDTAHYCPSCGRKVER